MRKEAEANADSDRQMREKVDKLNGADSLIFQTEKQLDEFGDKIPAEKKQPIEDALAKLKEAHKAEDMAGIDSAMETLNKVFQEASADMYANAQQAAPEGNGSAGAGPETADAEVTDVDFEEVKDNGK